MVKSIEKGQLVAGAFNQDFKGDNIMIAHNTQENQKDSDNEAIFKKLLEQAEESELSDREKVELEIVNELNKKHAIVHTSQTHVLTEKTNPTTSETTFCLETKKSFLEFYENKLIDIPTRSGKGQEQVSKGRIWLKHSNRREYKNGINFDPSNPGHSSTQYNIWKGFAINPKEGSCRRFLGHIRFIICDGDDVKYQYVIHWLAALVQKPDQGVSALVLIGLQGTGKNIFVEAIGKLFGQYFVQLSSLKELLGNFNSHLQNAVVIHANEALWGGDRREIGKVKSMITEEKIMIEGKGKDSIQVRNYRHLIFSSNESWPVHLDADDRRFIILHLSSEMKEDKQYFGAIVDELNDGGYEALLYYLLSVDLSNVDIRSIPLSDDAFEIKLQSEGPVPQYLYEALRNGSFDIGQESPSMVWKDECLTEMIVTDYRNWCGQEKVKPVSKQIFGRLIMKYTGAVKTRPREKGVRYYCYSWKSFDSAKQHFEKAFKSSNKIWEWGNDDDI